MSKLTKNQKSVADKVEAGKMYTLKEAAELVKEITTTKFRSGKPVAQTPLFTARGVAASRYRRRARFRLTQNTGSPRRIRHPMCSSRFCASSAIHTVPS